MERILGVISVGFFVILFLVLGYLVWIKEKITLFHSYHYDKVTEENKKAFCKISGIGLIVIGIGVLVAGIICSVTNSMWGGISLVGYKVTPKGMLQIFLKLDIPVDVLKRIFAETLV